MRRTVRYAVAFATLSACGACVIVPLPRGREFGPKVVTAKQQPNLLLAADGSRCQVTKQQYDAAAVGRDARCVWQPHDVGDRAYGTTVGDPKQRGGPDGRKLW